MDENSIGIDWLTSLSSEDLQTGPHGRVYSLQLQLDRAKDYLHDLRYSLAEEARRQTRPGSIGLSTPDPETHPDLVAQKARVEELRQQVAQGQKELGGIVFLPALDNLPEIQKRLATLNRRAEKLGSEPITLTVSDEKLLLHYNPDLSGEGTRAYDFEHVFAVLSGGAPKIPGFEFLATITPTEQGNVIKRIPPIAYGVRHGLEFGNDDREDTAAKRALESIDLTRFHETGDVCEHCHKERRRSDLYVVYNEATGEAKQVGRTCLRDYTGANDPERMVRHLEMVLEFFRRVGSPSQERPALPTEDFLTHCATILRSEAADYLKGLGYDASGNYYNWLFQERDRKTREPLWIEPIEADRQKAKTVLRWAREEWDETSEFTTNVKVALAGEAMNAKLLGLGGAVYAAYKRWLADADKREAAKAQQAANAEKGHVGTVGEREVFTLTLTSIKWIEDHYAPSYGNEPATKPLLIMTTPEGNEVKWFASNLPEVQHPEWDDEEARSRGAWGKNRKGVWYTGPVEGATYEVKATVKSHDDHERFGKSTVVSRCAFQRTLSEPSD